MRILFIGDIIGKLGRQIVLGLLPQLLEEYQVDLVLANGENAAGGFGITPSVAAELFALGIDLLTSGNHIWDRKEVEQFIQAEPRLLRPANYPPEAPGSGVYLVKRNGPPLGILNLQGRVFMPTIDCPFKVGEREVVSLKEKTNIIIVDFHAEATSEKAAFAWYFDGQVSAIIGTHTHVQTADERILPRGTAFITDVGMTGSRDSVIGMVKEEAIQKFLTQMPKKFKAATGSPQFNGVLVEVDEGSGKAMSIIRLRL
ncbi:MAG: TIGR00282 family metallophosphoesterase [candidate division NC10 bacterium]|nr:TIGR00282 family metallophosphoesterase [candidate division NC10 bacterium]